MGNSNYQVEIDSFRKRFDKFRDARIVLYGIGRYTATLIPAVSEFHIVGLMDRDEVNIGKSMYGVTVVSKEQAEKIADMVIINTSETYWRVIYNRIRDIKIPVYFLNGELASESDDKTYEENEYWNQTYEELRSKVKQYDVISFDIFDTLIMRKVFMPQDIFRIVEKRIKKELGLEIDFCRIRTEAGQDSNDRNRRLHEIYDILNQKLNLPVELLHQVMQTEIKVEKECCIPRSDMVKLYNEIQEEKDVYIVSDMYLPFDVVEDILRECGIQDARNLWISGEKRKNKKSGELWKEFSETVVRGRSALHIGDNDHSDIKVPQTFGIDTYYVMSSIKMWENSSIGDFVSRIRNFDESIFAGLIAARIFNSPFALHESRGKIVISNFEELGYCIWGGVILSFLMWLISQSRERGIKRLLFMARDGYLLQKDYEFIKQYYQEELPDDDYLAISRRLILVSSFEKDEDLDKILKFPYNGVFSEFLYDRFNVEIAENDIHADELVNVPQELDTVKAWIQPYKQAIIEQIKTERSNYLEYLSRLNITEIDGVIDLWYYGNNQYYLSKTAQRKLTGFYFAVNLDKNNPCMENNILLPCFQEYEDPIAANCNLKKADLWVESFLTAPYGMIKSLDSEGHFEYAQGGMNQKHFCKREMMNQKVCEFIADYLSLADTDTVLSPRIVDNFFGEYVKGGIAIADDMKTYFFYDNVIVKRAESPIFE